MKKKHLSYNDLKKEQQSFFTSTFQKSKNGAAIILFVMVFPVLWLFIGGVIDILHAFSYKAEIQALADAGSLAGASAGGYTTMLADGTPSFHVSPDGTTIDGGPVLPEGAIDAATAIISANQTYLPAGVFHVTQTTFNDGWTESPLYGEGKFKVDIKANVGTHFLRSIGIDTIELKANSMSQVFKL